MFGLIKKFFPYKTKSLKDFVEFVKKENCKSVVIRPDLIADCSAKTTAVGTIANFQHILEFTAVTPIGRKAICRKNLFVRFGSDQGFTDRDNRVKAIIKQFLLGEKKAKYLREKLPGVLICLMGPNGQTMNKATYAKLHRDAKACGVSI